MSIFTILFAVLSFLVVGGLGIIWRRWLAAAWIFSVLVLPLIRFQIGAPIYVMDVFSVLLLCQIIARKGRFVPFRILPWPWIFIGLALASTGAAGLLLFGFHPEQIWIWGHYSLSCLPMIFATFVRNDPDAYYTRPLSLGLTASLLALASIGIVQYFDLPGNQQIRDLFYGQFGSESKDIGLM